MPRRQNPVVIPAGTARLKRFDIRRHSARLLSLPSEVFFRGGRLPPGLRRLHTPVLPERAKALLTEVYLPAPLRDSILEADPFVVVFSRIISSSMVFSCSRRAFAVALPFYADGEARRTLPPGASCRAAAQPGARVAPPPAASGEAHARACAVCG